MMTSIPVITIDGTGGTGKGTISQRLAQHLNWHYLDSGALYRVLAFVAAKEQVAIDDEAALVPLAKSMDVTFSPSTAGELPRVLYKGEDVSDAVRTEQCGNRASQVGALPGVRQALLDRQRCFRQAPGLVTDGRDMGTVIFPDADVKFFFIASLEARAERRHRQLQRMGVNVNLPGLLEEITVRDQRDAKRQIAPMIPAEDAITLDTTGLTIDEVFEQVLLNVKQTLK